MARATEMHQQAVALGVTCVRAYAVQILVVNAWVETCAAVVSA